MCSESVFDEVAMNEDEYILAGIHVALHFRKTRLMGLSSAYTTSVGINMATVHIDSMLAVLDARFDGNPPPPLTTPLTPPPTTNELSITTDPQKPPKEHLYISGDRALDDRPLLDTGLAASLRLLVAAEAAAGLPEPALAPPAPVPLAVVVGILILRVPVLGVATLIAGWVPTAATLSTTGSGTFEQALGDPVVKEGRRAVAGDEI
ncbi:hypothetical protein N7488_010926 [Penicillium malachiteum]|nr:hypothetical protein N7488_010926 [Penicillium malachiteum]